jgi:ribosome-binding factor A
LCEEPAIEDGVDPRRFFRRGDQSGNHKTQRLCGAAQRTLSLCLSLGDETVRGLAVEAVEPATSPGLLVLVLRADRPLAPEDRARVLRALGSMRGSLRADIAAAVSRRRVPDLAFLVLGPGEARS